MRTSWKVLMVPVVAGLLAAGCASDGSGQKETMGTLIGAGRRHYGRRGHR